LADHEMRRKDRQITSPEQIREILKEAKICRLGLWDGEEPYVVPLSFGWRWENCLTLYFHCAPEGRKLDILRRFPKAAFEIDCLIKLVGGPAACGFSAQYRSLMGVGAVRFLTSPDEKRAALDAIMEQQTGKSGFSYTESQMDRVTVFCLRAERASAKAND